MDVALVLFTCDLRVRDNPALASACARARAVLPPSVRVPELASLQAPLIHTPWKLPEAERRRLGYPSPLTARPGERALTPQDPA